MMKAVLNASYVVVTFVALLILSSTANSDVIKHAGNGCFPRVFSQIDQFKISTGGLRNTSSNPRTIICSVDNDEFFPIYDADIGTFAASARIFTDESGLGTTCTFQARTAFKGSLIDSATSTINFIDFGGSSLGSVDWTFNEESDVYLYIQCVLPGNARIFSYSVTYSIDNTP